MKTKRFVGVNYLMSSDELSKNEIIQGNELFLRFLKIKFFGMNIPKYNYIIINYIKFHRSYNMLIKIAIKISSLSFVDDSKKIELKRSYLNLSFYKTMDINYLYRETSIFLKEYYEWIESKNK